MTRTILGALLLLISPATFAHELTGTATVVADSVGCFTYETSFAAGPGAAPLAAISLIGVDNTDVALVTEFLCNVTIADGETRVESNTGCLIDPTRGGTVIVRFEICDGSGGVEVFEHEVEILPCTTLDSALIPTAVSCASDGAFAFFSTFTAGCDGAALAGWEWFAVDNVSPFGLVADAFCATPLAAGESIDLPMAGSLIDPAAPGTIQVNIYPCGSSTGFFAEVTLIPAGVQLFVRGDVNNDDTQVVLSDALYLLSFGFTGGPAPACLESADSDGNGTLSVLTDALYLLNYGFGGGPPLAAPFPTCGPDPEPATSLGCAASSCTP